MTLEQQTERAVKHEWISVKDELPARKKYTAFSANVLVTDGKRISIGFYEYYPGNSDHNYWYASPISGYDVTHWQPIPEEPEE